MNIEEIISSIDRLNFDEVIKRESREYLTNGHKLVSFHDKDDDKKFVTNGLKRFVNKNDKMVFLLKTINYLNEEKAEAEGNLNFDVIDHFDWETNHSWSDREHYDYHKGLLNRSKKCETQIFYSVRELEKLGLSG